MFHQVNYVDNGVVKSVFVPVEKPDASTPQEPSTNVDNYKSELENPQLAPASVSSPIRIAVESNTESPEGGDQGTAPIEIIPDEDYVDSPSSGNGVTISANTSVNTPVRISNIQNLVQNVPVLIRSDIMSGTTNASFGTTPTGHLPVISNVVGSYVASNPNTLSKVSKKKSSLFKSMHTVKELIAASRAASNIACTVLNADGCATGVTAGGRPVALLVVPSTSTSSNVSTATSSTHRIGTQPVKRSNLRHKKSSSSNVPSILRKAQSTGNKSCASIAPAIVNSDSIINTQQLVSAAKSQQLSNSISELTGQRTELLSDENHVTVVPYVPHKQGTMDTAAKPQGFVSIVRQPPENACTTELTERNEHDYATSFSNQSSVKPPKVSKRKQVFATMPQKQFDKITVKTKETPEKQASYQNPFMPQLFATSSHISTNTGGESISMDIETQENILKNLEKGKSVTLSGPSNPKTLFRVKSTIKTHVTGKKVTYLKLKTREKFINFKGCSVVLCRLVLPKHKHRFNLKNFSITDKHVIFDKTNTRKRYHKLPTLHQFAHTKHVKVARVEPMKPETPSNELAECNQEKKNQMHLSSFPSTVVVKKHLNSNSTELSDSDTAVRETEKVNVHGKTELIDSSINVAIEHLSPKAKMTFDTVNVGNNKATETKPLSRIEQLKARLRQQQLVVEKLRPITEKNYDSDGDIEVS